MRWTTCYVAGTWARWSFACHKASAVALWRTAGSAIDGVMTVYAVRAWSRRGGRRVRHVCAMHAVTLEMDNAL